MDAIDLPPPKDAPILEVNGNRSPVTPEPMDYRGLFGMKGNLRDIVGLIGDAFLTQAGRAPIYMPSREAEMASNALQGFYDGNDMDKEAALARLSTIDPYKAAELKGKLEQEALTRAYRENAMENRDRMNDLREQDLRRRQLESYNRLGNLAKASNEKTWPTVRARLQKMAAQLGIQEDFPEQYDPDWINAFASAGMSPYQAERADMLKRDTDSKIANRGRIKPTRPGRPVVIMRDGKRVYVRPEDAINQEAPAPAGRGGGGGGGSKEPPKLPPGFKRLPDGRIQGPDNTIYNARPKNKG